METCNVNVSTENNTVISNLDACCGGMPLLTDIEAGWVTRKVYVKGKKGSERVLVLHKNKLYEGTGKVTLPLSTDRCQVSPMGDGTAQIRHDGVTYIWSEVAN